MKDRWINAGHEEDELKPFVEPELDISDQKRIGNYPVVEGVCLCASVSARGELGPGCANRLVCCYI